MPESGKLKYSVDDFNRLLVIRGSRQYPLEGEFKIDRNRLVFEPQRKSPLAEELSLPERIKFQGNWSLSENYDLAYSLLESGSRKKADTLQLRGRIISCEADSLVFETKCKKTHQKDKISLLRLNGKWQANVSNELNFLVQSDRQEDVLTFKGAWKLNRNQEITYTYEKQDLRRKSRAREELTFQGFWQINSRDNISYILDLDQGSLFEFKVQLQQPDLKGDRRQIKYRIGIGGKGFRRERVFSLFGSWRVESSKNIFFQVDCAETGVKALTFAADVFLNNNNQLVFELKNRQGKPLGITVSFERAFLKKRAALFARLSKARSIHSLEAGVKIPW